MQNYFKNFSTYNHFILILGYSRNLNLVYVFLISFLLFQTGGLGLENGKAPYWTKRPLGPLFRKHLAYGFKQF